MSENIVLPKVVKVACYDIRVVEWTKKEGDLHKAFGHFSTDELEICVCVEVDMNLIIDTLIHEILHAIYWIYNIKDDDKEERTVTTLATGFTQVLRDSPGLAEFIGKVAA